LRVPSPSRAPRRSAPGIGAAADANRRPSHARKAALGAAGGLCAACGGPAARAGSADRDFEMNYLETYRRSLEKPEEFWAEAAEAIEWEKRWDKVLDDSRPPFYRWFAGGRAQHVLERARPSRRGRPRRA